MVGMITGKRANAVGAEELVLVEHGGQHPTELSFIQDGGEHAAVGAWFSRVVDEGNQFRTRLEEPLETLDEFREPVSEAHLDRRGGAEGKQADERANFQALG